MTSPVPASPTAPAFLHIDDFRMPLAPGVNTAALRSTLAAATANGAVVTVNVLDAAGRPMPALVRPGNARLIAVSPPSGGGSQPSAPPEKAPPGSNKV